MTTTEAGTTESWPEEQPHTAPGTRPARFGEPLPDELRDPAEKLGREEIRALQLERLRATLDHAYANVPLYRRKFDEAGVRPEDLRTLEDIARFPYTTKADLRETYPFGMFAVPRERVRRLHASSGTTGRPTVVGYTDSDLSNWAGLVARSLRAAGARPGDRVHVSYGYGLFTGGLGAHYGVERAGCTVIPASGGQTARQVQLIQDFEPDLIMVTPSYMLTLLDEFERQGVDPRSTKLRAGVFGAEPWTEEMRREIEDRMGIHAVDIYGLSEVMGPGVASECVETKDGLHIWEDQFLPEVVDPITDEVLPDGTSGELVFTSLTKEALPIIRYRTRDLTRLLPGTARPGMRRMEKVTGRCDDMIILRGVNLFPSQIEEILLRVPALAPHFQIHLGRRGRMDHLTVRVEARQDSGPEAREAAAAVVLKQIKDTIGVSVGIEVVDPDTLERSVGKIKRIMDERGK
ncbi:phenylacetate--CoA ligase PaaK [Streptomyces sp. AM 3-1-1]|uniref:phenylacetate--CoA ligase PaaK n=1 Tax=Streptomyces sp. AM 3-1-1 TaxID=3028711 RepID=UPI0023B97374|nr:phenylacetate--CoA ligase PaaK [Streptomyces sp. AM 3-1-1]WEH26018.1 phenylacetate--CoA ligase [Streptomyces sp. AM 3-1-1]